MTKKVAPFSLDEIQALAEKHSTPFHVYDEAGIREQAMGLKGAFDSAGARDYKNFFAVKALPNPRILQILKEEGMGVDCSSLTELILAENIGFRGDDVFLTSNNTPANVFKHAARLGAITNFDDIDHLPFYRGIIGTLPEIGCARYNPGELRHGNAIIGDPVESKFGATREQMMAIYKTMRDNGVKKFGIHAMVASGTLDESYLVETANMLFKLMLEMRAKLGITIDLVNLGGGFGIPYRPTEQPIDIGKVAIGIQESCEKLLLRTDYPQPRIVTENGRYITGPHGYLITTVLHTKSTYKDYAGVDASMADLMRPGMYGAYHHISVLGKEEKHMEHKYDVVGGLCENNDKFAIDRQLPHIERGDILMIHDTGAHGSAMGFNYNGALHGAEFLFRSNRTFEMIRRPQTVQDIFGTLV